MFGVLFGDRRDRGGRVGGGGGDAKKPSELHAKCRSYDPRTPYMKTKSKKP